VTEFAIDTVLAPGAWTLDPAASTATFVAHQLGRAIPGSIPIRGASAVIGPDRDIRGAHVELDIAAISTGIEKRDLDLAKPRLLNTARFPTLSVEVAPAQWTGKGWDATGTIRVRGIEFPVGLAITVEALEISGAVRVQITAAFNRKPIGIKAPNLVIGRNIEVAVRASFTRDADLSRTQ
jgi:polyisoprenoid-binding protein YceI